MRKKFFFGIGIIMLCITMWTIFKVTSPHKNVSGELSVATLPASDLYKEFLNTEIKANKKWVGRVIEISGFISSITENGKYVAIGLEGSETGGINCSFLKNDMLPGQHFNKGDSITIKGKCTGFLVDVNMVDCIVQK